MFPGGLKDFQSTSRSCSPKAAKSTRKSLSCLSRYMARALKIVYGVPTVSDFGGLGESSFCLDGNTDKLYFMRNGEVHELPGGSQGPQGVQGPQGLQGIQGIQGPQG